MPVKTPPAVTTFQETVASGNILNKMVNQVDTMMTEMMFLKRRLTKVTVSEFIAPVYCLRKTSNPSISIPLINNIPASRMMISDTALFSILNLNGCPEAPRTFQSWLIESLITLNKVVATNIRKTNPPATRNQFFCKGSKPKKSVPNLSRTSLVEHLGKLNNKDKLSYDDFKREMQVNLEAFKFHENYIPFQQFWGMPLTMGQLGSGTGIQPFKTVKDYDDWLSRAARFADWADSSIVYFKKGIAANYLLPKALVVKMIPEMEAMLVRNDTASLFYGPVKTFPAGFSDADKKRLTTAFTDLIHDKILPSYKKLGDFLKHEYLQHARGTSGISALPGGKEYYQYLIRSQTTTNKTPEEIYQTGLNEVARIGRLQDSVKNAVAFKGDLGAFFEFMKTGKQFMPFKSAAEVLAAFEKIHRTIEPNLQKNV